MAGLEVGTASVQCTGESHCPAPGRMCSVSREDEDGVELWEESGKQEEKGAVGTTQGVSDSI